MIIPALNTRFSGRQEKSEGNRAPPLFRLGLLTGLAIVIHGYHFGVDDAAIYLPAVLKAIHPDLFPYGAEFFQAHSGLSQFAAVVGASARLLRLDAEWAVFLWHLLTVFGFLLAAWRMASLCFHSEAARWSAVLLVAELLTLPAAGTGLVLMDPYLTARSASTPLGLLAISAFLDSRWREGILWLALGMLVHPLMIVYTAGCCAILALPESWIAPIFEPRLWTGAAAAAFSAAFGFEPASSGYRQAIELRSFLSVLHWRWYERLGVAAPLIILIVFSRWRPRGSLPAFARIGRSLTLLGLFATVIAVVFAANPRFDMFLRFQPMRAFHPIYIVFFLLLGGILGEYFLKSRRWLWFSFFAIMGAGMLLVQRQAYAHSLHVELPGALPTNSWVSAFLWTSRNTPQNAVFALNPDYIELSGEDRHGFRAIARRSALTDRFKDSGIVSLFPNLADEWEQEQTAQQNWSRFQLADFQQLAKKYPVSWIVLEGRTVAGLDCPYRNLVVAVCHIPGARGLK